MEKNLKTPKTQKELKRKKFDVQKQSLYFEEMTPEKQMKKRLIRSQKKQKQIDRQLRKLQKMNLDDPASNEAFQRAQNELIKNKMELLEDRAILQEIMEQNARNFEAASITGQEVFVDLVKTKVQLIQNNSTIKS